MPRWDSQVGTSCFFPLDPEVEQHLSVLCRGKTPDAFVFSPDDEGIMPWGQNVFRRTWERVCKRLGMEGVALDPGTRYSSATQTTDRGVDSQIMKDMLGHTTFKMTDRYAKIKTDRLRAALRADVLDRMGDQSRRVLDM